MVIVEGQLEDDCIAVRVSRKAQVASPATWLPAAGLRLRKHKLCDLRTVTVFGRDQ